MSSGCVCHLNEWCFYCEMYSPLESKFELQEAENAALKQQIEQGKEQLQYYEASIKDFGREIEQLKADNAALLDVLVRLDQFFDLKEEIIAGDSIGSVDDASFINAVLQTHISFSNRSEVPNDPA